MHKFRPDKTWLPVIFLLTGAFVVRVFQFGSAAPFLDESTYILLGLRGIRENFSILAEAAFWVGGSPFVYPAFTTALYLAGGLLLSRLGNVLLGVLLVYLVYVFILEWDFFVRRREINRLAALLGAAVFATSAVPVYLSRLAIYDMPADTLFLAAIVLLMRIIKQPQRRLAVITTILFFASFLTKYITGIFLLFVILVALWTARRQAHETLRLILVREFVFVCVFLTVMYVLLNLDALSSFLVENAPSSGGTRGEVLRLYWEPSKIYFLLSLSGIWFVFDRRKRQKVILLLGAAAAPLVAHIFLRNTDAAVQSSLLSLIFLSPLVGWILMSVIRSSVKIGMLTTILVVNLNLATSLPQVFAWESGWPDTILATEFLRTKVKKAEPLLLEGGDIYTLALYDKVDAENVSGPFVFTYGDYTGQEAYMQAVSDGYFRFIELEGYYFSAGDIKAIEDKIPLKYTLAFYDGKIRIYERIR